MLGINNESQEANTMNYRKQTEVGDVQDQERHLAQSYNIERQEVSTVPYWKHRKVADILWTVKVKRGIWLCHIRGTDRRHTTKVKEWKQKLQEKQEKEMSSWRYEIRAFAGVGWRTLSEKQLRMKMMVICLMYLSKRKLHQTQ